tara:strand:- start:2741 stop:3013 length:273 start_codon:yes stop_codon:yes gene_type:complete
MTYLPHAYKCIAIWGRELGSFPSYSKREQQIASQDDAPITAIYKRGDVWVTAEQIENVAVKNDILIKLAHLAAGAYPPTKKSKGKNHVTL